MDPRPEAELSIALARKAGWASSHKNMSDEESAREIDRSRSDNGVKVDPDHPGPRRHGRAEK